jgi:hypothetical protein
MAPKVPDVPRTAERTAMTRAITSTGAAGGGPAGGGPAGSGAGPGGEAAAGSGAAATGQGVVACGVGHGLVLRAEALGVVPAVVLDLCTGGSAAADWMDVASPAEHPSAASNLTAIGPPFSDCHSKVRGNPPSVVTVTFRSETNRRTHDVKERKSTKMLNSTYERTYERINELFV